MSVSPRLIGVDGIGGSPRVVAVEGFSHASRSAAVAVQGVGFGARSMAMQGFAAYGFMLPPAPTPMAPGRAIAVPGGGGQGAQMSVSEWLRRIGNAGQAVQEHAIEAVPAVDLAKAGRSRRKREEEMLILLS